MVVLWHHRYQHYLYCGIIGISIICTWTLRANKTSFWAISYPGPSVFLVSSWLPGKVFPATKRWPIARLAFVRRFNSQALSYKPFNIFCLIYRSSANDNFWISKDHLTNSSEREAGSFVDQDQQYFLIKRKTKCKADRTAQRVILMPNISVSHY